MPRKNVFETILEQGHAKNKFGANTIASAQWLRNKAQELGGKHVKPGLVLGDNSRYMGGLLPGRMFLMHYDPKHKATLPYYDRYPLFFMVDYTRNGFYGINLHYLPLRERAILMDNLFSFLSDTTFNEATRLRLSYNLLKSAEKVRNFKPCFKQYLYSQIKQGPVFLHPIEWNISLFLPLQRFVKASNNKVYADSRKIINGI